jgi:hypothetical protein
MAWNSRDISLRIRGQWKVDTGLGKWEDHDRDMDGIDLVERHKTSFDEGL